MKAFALLLIAVGLICGCAQRYKVTFHNRQELTTSSRPKFDKATETYQFKDDTGKPVVIPGFRVKQIEPL
jgi:ABC-type Fe3+-hydroxamate transport system substrate-binding protein